jgi:DNA ligase-associated metallophosphoesterase
MVGQGLCGAMSFVSVPSSTPRPPELVTVASVALIADWTGAIFWPEEGLLAVADLHLEKGSSYARRGILLPPYDTAATLAVLAQLLTRYDPKVVIALGDSFHDGGGPHRLAASDRQTLQALPRGRDWIWITGNHDPHPAPALGGSFVATLSLGPLTFRHEPAARAAGEIAGHLHPMARVVQRGRSLRRRCFAGDGTRIVLPALGAFTGGLNVRDRAFANLFDAATFTAHLLGTQRLYAVAANRCLPD